MSSRAFSAPGLNLTLEEKPQETIVHCSGRITVESADLLQTEIRDHVIPMSRGKGVDVTTRVVLDLSNVSFVDSTGLGALFTLWTAAQRRAVDLEIVNLTPRVQELVSLTKLDQVFTRMRNLFTGGEPRK